MHKLILLDPDRYYVKDGEGRFVLLDGLRIPRCVHSGYCCKKSQCPVSLQKYGDLPEYQKPYEDRQLDKLCPALYQKDGDFLCRHADEFKDQLYIGDGCCSAMNSERQKKLIQLGIVGKAGN